MCVVVWASRSSTKGWPARDRGSVLVASVVRTKRRQKGCSRPAGFNFGGEIGCPERSENATKVQVVIRIHVSVFEERLDLVALVGISILPKPSDGASNAEHHQVPAAATARSGSFH